MKPPGRLPRRNITLLRRTFLLVERQSGVAGLSFYRNLFILDPSLRGLFQTSIELQSRKLMEALSFAIATLERPEALVPELHALGRRHLAYGAKNEHYDTVVEALLQTLAQTLGRCFTSRTRRAWEEALSFIAQTMKEGAAQSLPAPENAAPGVNPHRLANR